ncbi:MAG: hypothetical protein AB1401_15210 [Thermodesulfobacteriota bacterium]
MKGVGALGAMAVVSGALKPLEALAQETPTPIPIGGSELNTDLSKIFRERMGTGSYYALQLAPDTTLAVQEGLDFASLGYIVVDESNQPRPVIVDIPVETGRDGNVLKVHAGGFTQPVVEITEGTIASFEVKGDFFVVGPSGMELASSKEEFDEVSQSGAWSQLTHANPGAVFEIVSRNPDKTAVIKDGNGSQHYVWIGSVDGQPAGIELKTGSTLPPEEGQNINQVLENQIEIHSSYKGGPWEKQKILDLLNLAISIHPEGSEIWQTIKNRCGKLDVVEVKSPGAITTFGYSDKRTEVVQESPYKWYDVALEPSASLGLNFKYLGTYSQRLQAAYVLSELWGIANLIKTGRDYSNTSSATMEREKSVVSSISV